MLDIVPPPKLSVIVPTRNRAHLLGDCLDALTRQSIDSNVYEVVVVDNGSTDATAEVASSRSSDVVNVVSSPVAGLNKARNTGIRATRGEIIAFVDDDELVPPRHVASIIDILGQHPEAGGVGGPLQDRSSSGRTCPDCTLGSVAVREEDGWAIGLIGGNMAIRRSAFDAVGLFDEDLSGQGDETEWFARAARAGIRFLHEPSLVVDHRRDVFSLREILLIQFRQGRTRPLSTAKSGGAYRPRVGRAVRALGHGIRRRCAGGLARFAGEMGSIVTWCSLVARRKQ